MTFGEKIRMMREDMEISQTKLAEELGMTQRKISYIETDKYEPCMEDIISFALFFKVSADYLLGLPKEMPYPKR